MGEGLDDFGARAASGENGDDRCDGLTIVWRTGRDIEEELEAANVPQLFDRGPRTAHERRSPDAKISGTFSARSGRIDLTKYPSPSMLAA